MSSITDLDTGPLTWVKGEIDLALARAAEAIDAAERDADRNANLQFAQTHLHQVRGALSIVGLDGLTAFTDSLDRLLAELARGDRAYRPQLASLSRRALAAIGNYLDELSHGVPDQALRLLPLYAELAAARDLPAPVPADLFFPDLGLLPPRGQPAPANAATIFAERLRSLRSHFQAGLLKWIRQPSAPEGALAMREVCVEIQSLQTTSTGRSFWWVAGAFFETLAGGGLSAVPAAKLVCSRIDGQLKRMGSGPATPAEHLQREMLYLIASASQVGPVAQEVRETYGLLQLLPPPGSALCDQPLAPLQARLRGLFAEARDTWDHFAGGAAAALPQFEDDLKRAIAASAPLGRPAFRQLLDTLAEVTAWLRKDPLRTNEQVALEVASAVMLAETALEAGRVPDASFTAQVARSQSRLGALMAGQDPDQTEPERSGMPDAAREAQERLALGQLAREMQVNLAQVEQTLDDYFRHPARRAALAALDAPLRQIEGVLCVLGEDRALEVLKDCESRIRRLASSEEAPAPDEFEFLAHHLSAFGFFVQDLQRGKADLDRLLRGPEPTAAAEEPPAEAPAVAEALPELPIPEPAPVAAPAPPPAPEIIEAPAEIPAPPPTAAPVPPPPAPELLQASDAEIDSELLEIFLEEGREVVANIADHLKASRANPHDMEVLTTIRRAFHTLKGSGRMVGLTDLGEAAWGMEQTLNRWLQLEWRPTPALHALIGEAFTLFDAWIEQLASGGGLNRDARALLEEARRLRESDQPIEDAAPAAATPPPATEEAALSARIPDLPSAFDLELPDIPELEVTASAALEPPAEAAQPVELETPAKVDLPTEFDLPAEPAEFDLASDFELPEEAETVQAGGASEAATEEPADEIEAAPLDFDLPFGEEPLAEEFALEIDEALPPAAVAAPAPAAEPVEDDFRETSLDFGELLESPEDDGVLPIGTLEFSPLETSLDSFELREDDALGPFEAPPVTPPTAALPAEPDTTPGGLDEIDFGDIEGDEGAAEEIQLTELEDEAEDALLPEVPPLEPPQFEETVTLEDLGLEDEALTEATTGIEPAADQPAAEAAGRPAWEAPVSDEPPSGAEIVGDLEEIDELETLPAAEAEIEDLAELDYSEEAAPACEPEALENAYDPDVVRLGDNALSRPLFDLYLVEARQHLATLRRELGHLQVNPTLLPADPAIRAAHTLAGISGTAHVDAIHAIAKSLEHAQARFRDAGQPPATEQTDLLSRSADTLEAMLAEVARESLPLPAPELVEQLDAMLRLGFSQSIAPLPASSDEAPAAPAEAPAEAPPAAVLRDEFDVQLLPIFLEEAGELLDQLHTALRDWRGTPAARATAPLIARLLHTLKGSARMAGAMGLGERVHGLETRLEEGADQPLALIEELEAGLDSVSLTLDEMATGPIPADEPAQPAAEAAAAELAAPAPTVELEGPSTTASLRVRADLVDKFVNEAGEIGIARTRIDGELRTLRRSLLDLTENVIRLRNQLREIEIQAETQLQSRIALSSGAEGEFDPLELDRFTRLQELTRMMAESVNDVTTVQHNLLKNLDGAESALSSQARLNRDLQQALMRVRMVPFDSIADRLHRVVRQSAKDLGKRVTLDIRGGTTEIDRSVLERMTAPLEHLLRNSIAHGIESPERRASAGKAEIGQITLRLAQEGNEVAIELADDGGGLDYARIRARALENGLISEAEASDERRLTNLIFMPGFSTATSLSAVSGRGVGMDVVKSETAAVGGRIEIASEAGKGTRFRIYLPVNLAVTQALLVKSGGRTYAIPSTMVAQVRELKVDALEELRRERQLTWQDQIYSYRYLPRLVGDADTQPEIQRFNWVLLLRAGAQTLALHVDGLRGNQEIVVKNAGPHLARIVGISGATVMGDGEIVLILNPVALAGRPDVIPEDIDRTVHEQRPVAHVPTVMVVDDSLTVRKITGRLLEREGYRVITAKDGVDALERLIETVPDVILSDIEMPRMDGFDLARNIRADARLRALPIIMITSRLADKHKEYAREIGVQHYLGKPYQEEELLGLIGRYAPLHASA